MPPPNLSPQDTAKWVVLLVVALLQYIVLGVGLYVFPQYCKEDMHTSALSGRAWLNELLVGHPKRIYIALGMRRHVFLALVLQIRALGYMESQQSRLNLDESLAIFLYTCVTGLAIDHVAERFQHSHTTISEHFRKILDILSGPEFYSKYVQLPDANAPPPSAIRTIRNEDLHSARNRKGGVTQNCLAVVSFNMRFLFFTSGWDGCAADASMYSAARLRDLPIPEGKFYLADAGFGICEALPANYKELYNLRHASARNVVERIFGVIKHRWTILTRPPHYDMKVQAKIPSALVALHNFILEHDEEDIDRWILDEGAEDNLRGARRAQEIDFGRLSTTGRVSAAEKERAEKTRDEIAKAMWEDYQEYLDTRMDVDNNYYGDNQPEALD
ncbi:putative transposase [Mycena sanguinolenta]|uniref:Putative transposase n=1 Tax=Mycena sanguinolenta TaxID=230812 RepID=A0A8H6YZX4_9AGAR|nr:putative transposase [Mycena sanguinolenta]